MAHAYHLSIGEFDVLGGARSGRLGFVLPPALAFAVFGVSGPVSPIPALVLVVSWLLQRRRRSGAAWSWHLWPVCVTSVFCAVVDREGAIAAVPSIARVFDSTAAARARGRTPKRRCGRAAPTFAGHDRRRNGRSSGDRNAGGLGGGGGGVVRSASHSVNTPALQPVGPALAVSGP